MPVSGTAAAGASTTSATSATSTALIVASIAATAASAAIAARNARAQSKTQSAIAQANSESEKEKAAQLKTAGQEKQRQILEERRRILARNRAKYGKAGVTMEGSPLLLQQEAAKNVTLDAAMANYNTQIGVREAEYGSELSLLKGKSARTTGRLRAGQALFSGATQIASTSLQIQSAKNN